MQTRSHRRRAAGALTRARIWLSTGWLLGCALGQPAPATRTAAPGNPAAEPALSVLPEVPEDASFDTPRTHQGMLVAREALDSQPPSPPHDLSYPSLRSWVDHELVAWLDQRRMQTEATSARFELEGEPTAGELAVQHAVLGLLHEDTALVLARLPAPSELEREPEITRIYREVVDTQAEGFLASAVIAFRDCADAAYRASEQARPWAEFCHARFDRLKRRLSERQRDLAAPPVAAQAAQ